MYDKYSSRDGTQVTMNEDAAIDHLPPYTVVLRHLDGGPCEACKELGETAKATFWCKQCWDFLCENCGYTHLVTYPLHRLSPVCRNFNQLQKWKYDHNRFSAEPYSPAQAQQDPLIPQSPPRPVYVSRPSGGSSDKCSWSTMSRSVSDLALFQGISPRRAKRWNSSVPTPPSVSTTATLNCNLESVGRNAASSSCFLPNGDVVVISYEASNIKIYHSPSYGFATEVAAKTKPYDVATMRSGVWADLLLVVTAQETQIYFYKVKQGGRTILVPCYKIDTQKQYVGVSGIKGTDLLVVTAPGQYPPCLDIISSSDAVILRTIDDCTSSFAMMRYVTTTGSYVFVTDTDRDIVVRLNLNRTFSSNPFHKDKLHFSLPGTTDGRVHRGLSGLCVHRGLVFVASQEENNIHVLTLQGKYCGELPVVNGGFVAPSKVTVDHTGRMAVTQKDGRVRILWLNVTPALSGLQK